MTGAPGAVVLPEPRVRLGRRPVSWFQVCGVAGALAWLGATGLGAVLRDLPWGPLAGLAATAVAVFLLLAVGTALVVGEGRLTWFHHQLAIVAASGLLLMIMERPVLGYLDLVGTGLLAFGACGRVGCLLVGCCHGRPVRSGRLRRLGVVYGPAHVRDGLGPAYAGVALVPVQLLEVVALTALTAGGLVTLGSNAPAGVALSLSLVGYAVARFALEPLRGDRRLVAGLSEAQWTAVAVVAAVGAGWALTLR